MDFIDILHEEWLFCCTGAANAVQELPPQISQFVLPQDHHNYTVSTSSLYQWPEVEEWLLHLLESSADFKVSVYSAENSSNLSLFTSRRHCCLTLTASFFTQFSPR